MHATIAQHELRLAQGSARFEALSRKALTGLPESIPPALAATAPLWQPRGDRRGCRSRLQHFHGLSRAEGSEPRPAAPRGLRSSTWGMLSPQTLWEIGEKTATRMALAVGEWGRCEGPAIIWRASGPSAGAMKSASTESCG